MNDTIPQWLARIEGRELDLYAMLKKIVNTASPVCGALAAGSNVLDRERKALYRDIRYSIALLDEIGERPDEKLS